jgi:hypothetical protein
MSYWVDIMGHPNFKVISEYLPRAGETVIIGPDTFEGQEGNLTYHVVCVQHRIELGVIGLESPLVILEGQLGSNISRKRR